MSGTLELQVVVFLILIFLSFTCSYLLRKYNVTWFPESAATLLLGFIFGVVWHYIPSQKDITFSPDLFFFVLLPAIIFESGYSVHRQRFFKNFGAILIFAIIGTLITSIAVAGFMFVTCKLKGGYPDLTFLEFFIFGAIISATDPVATLSIFSKLNAHPGLYSLVFGESMLNDAAAITLFRTLVIFYDTELTVKTFFLATGKFLLIFFGSAIIGIIVGALCSLLMKKTNIKEEPPLELILIVGSGYFAYFFCDVITLSGIVSIFFVGISLRHYAYYCLSETSKKSTSWFLTAFKEGSETAVFALLGFTIFYSEKYDIFIIGMGVLACIFGRIFAIFPFSNMLNLCRSAENRISCKWQLVIWNAGLKGAVAVGLSLSHEMHGRQQWGVMITTIHIVVIFSILFHGILTTPLVKMTNKYDIRKNGSSKITRIHSLWNKIDSKYIIPIVSYPRYYADETPNIEPEVDYQDTAQLDESSINVDGYEETESLLANSDNDNVNEHS